MDSLSKRMFRNAIKEAARINRGMDIGHLLSGDDSIARMYLEMLDARNGLRAYARLIALNHV